MLHKCAMCSMIILAVAFSQNVYVSKGDVRLSPRMFNYQGYLTDTLGIPITNPSLSMSFTIYDAVSAGNQQWTETQSSVSVNKGIFHVLLGSVSPIPDSVFLRSMNHWLELTVGGQTLTPRTQIVSSAYSLTSTFSDTSTYACDAPDYDWIRSGGQVYAYNISDRIGIATTTPRYTLDVNGIICGGINDTVNVLYGGVLAGYGNLAGNSPIDTGAVVTGGYKNLATGKFSYVGCGNRNFVDSTYATIVNGLDCYVGGYGSFVGCGVNNLADSSYSFIGGGYQNQTLGNFAAVVGGYHNRASDSSAVAVGGWRNSAIGKYAFIGGGFSGVASGQYATVGGGLLDSCKATYGGVFSGNKNIAGDATVDTGAIVCGGMNNAAIGKYSMIGGGYGDTASGNYATVPGGRDNKALGDYSFTAGRRARASYGGCFVWGDSTNSLIQALGACEWRARCSGGVTFYSNSAMTTGVVLNSGTSSWASACDRNTKENFQPIDGSEILKKLENMPITTWNYKSQDPSIRHIGPMAQDFAAFSVGEDDKHISTIDADGVALAAIQELNRRLEKLEAENDMLKQKIEELSRK